jgi:hypothetical protein
MLIKKEFEEFKELQEFRIAIGKRPEDSQFPRSRESDAF